MAVRTPTLRSFLVSLLVALSGVTYSAMAVWSGNAHVPPLRLVQLIALEAALYAGVLALVAWRGGDLTVSAVTLSLAGMLFGSGGALAERIGAAGAWAFFFLSVGACLALLKRVAASNVNSLRVLAVWLSTFLFLQPVLSVVLDRDVSQSSVVASPALVDGNTGLLKDFVLVVFDGYTSPATLRDEFSFDSPLRNPLTEEGFEVVDSAWSPSTRTMFSISALLNFGSPLTTGEGVTGGDIAALVDMIRGDARLFSMFRDAGYQLTYVESGWVGSVCGEAADTCVRRGFVDEAVQTVIDRSLLNDFAMRRWGHAFAQGGLRSLNELERIIRDMDANGANDIVFAHVVLPHGPYVLGSDCQTTGTRIDEPADPGSQDEIFRAAYLEQVNCVDRWLAPLAASIPQDAAVVFTADHGSLFRGQMSRAPATWSAEDIAERSQVFLATRLPESCSASSNLSGSLEAVMDATDCLLGTHVDRTATETLWLFSDEAVPRCIELPGATWRSLMCPADSPSEPQNPDASPDSRRGQRCENRLSRPRRLKVGYLQDDLGLPVHWNP